MRGTHIGTRKLQECIDFLYQTGRAEDRTMHAHSRKADLHHTLLLTQITHFPALFHHLLLFRFAFVVEKGKVAIVGIPDVPTWVDICWNERQWLAIKSSDSQLIEWTAAGLIAWAGQGSSSKIHQHSEMCWVEHNYYSSQTSSNWQHKSCETRLIGWLAMK